MTQNNNQQLNSKDFMKEIENEINKFNEQILGQTPKNEVLSQIKGIASGENDFYKLLKNGDYLIYTKKQKQPF